MKNEKIATTTTTHQKKHDNISETSKIDNGNNRQADSWYILEEHN